MRERVEREIERVREGGRDGEREGGREGGRERGRERGTESGGGRAREREKDRLPGRVTKEVLLVCQAKMVFGDASVSVIPPNMYHRHVRSCYQHRSISINTEASLRVSRLFSCA